MASYKYDNLDISAGAIRVILLMKGEVFEPLRCRLIETSLDLDLPYEALSYTWGSDKPSTQYCITLDEQEMAITENLYQALYYLRLIDKDRLLWIDAICIDQANDREKTHQVQQMRLVYEHATCVLIWLGQSSLDTDTNSFMDFVSEVDMELISSLPQTRWESSIKERFNERLERRRAQAAISLASRPWFRRVWVLQEVASARSGTVICGRKSAPARTFALLMLVLLGTDLPSHVRPVLEIMPGPRRRGVSWWMEERDLLTLLKKFRQSEASDARDKVYALIGISSDAAHDGLFQPDYGRTKCEFVHDTISYLLFGNVLPQDFPNWTDSELFGHADDLPQQVFNWARNKEDLSMIMMLLSPRNEQSIGRYNIGLGADGKDEHGRTAISWAAERGHPEIAKLLFERGKIDPDLEDGSGRTPLSLATEKGYSEIVQLLLDAKADPDIQDKSRRTPLSWAAERGHPEIVQLLLDAKADPDIQDNSGQTPLSWAIERGFPGIVQLLLDIRRADPNIQDKFGRTPLLWAAERGYYNIVKLLLDIKADPDIQDKSRRTPLSWAAERGHPEIVQLLLDIKADPDIQDNSGQTPLSWAVERGFPRIVKLLLDTKADPDIQDKSRRTPLLLAAEKGHPEIVQLLLDLRRADPNIQDNFGRIPLSWAAERGHPEIVQLLLDIRKADPNIQDNFGRTPLSWAAERGYYNIVKLLLDTKADPDIQDKSRRTPLLWAAERGYYKIVKLLWN